MNIVVNPPGGHGGEVEPIESDILVGHLWLHMLRCMLYSVVTTGMTRRPFASGSEVGMFKTNIERNKESPDTDRGRVVGQQIT
jgi:hypothetical protein